MRHYYQYLILIFAISNCLSQTPSQKLVDKIIARVGGEYILLSEVEEEFSYAKKSNPNVTDNEKCQILDGLVGQKLVIHQAKIDSIEVSDEQIASELDIRFEKILAQMNGDEDFFKEYYGASVSDMKERYREDQKQQMLARRMQETLISKVRITPTEVLDFFNGIPTDSLPYFGAEVELAELVLKPTVNRDNRQKALNLIEELHKRVKEGGESFDDIAKKYSQDPESAKRGGDLGFARRGTFVPEFESAAFSLKKDEISDIIETDFGFHFLRLEERRGNLIRVKHVLISASITKDDEDLAKAKLDSIRSLILKDSLDFLTAVRRYADKNTPSFHNGGKLRNPNSGNSYFEIKDLDYDSYFAIESLDINGISSVLEVEGQRGDKMFRILQLQSKSKPHRMSLQSDYDKVASMAKESKKAIYFNDWMKILRSKASIQIDDMYQKGCPNLVVYNK